MESSKSSIAASARSPSALRVSMLMTILVSLIGPVISTRRRSRSAGISRTFQGPEARAAAAPRRYLGTAPRSKTRCRRSRALRRRARRGWSTRCICPRMRTTSGVKMRLAR